MKTSKKIVPTLLTSSEAPRLWRVRVDTRDDYCEMRFSNREHAHSEYQRLRQASIFAGQWITELVIEEVVNAEI